jgi:hypothetical protein
MCVCSAVGCGKKLLIVGDSTVKSLSDFYGMILRHLNVY